MMVMHINYLCPARYGVFNYIAITILIFISWTFLFAADFKTEKANFQVKAGNEIIRHRIMALFLLPGEQITLEAGSNFSGALLLIDKSSAQKLPSSTPNTWRYTAPSETGEYTLTIYNIQEPDSIVLHVLVIVPYKQLKGEYLNGYRIGKYPEVPLKQLPIYAPPRGFIEVTETNKDLSVSPHFTLGQFVSKQGGGYPRYLVLKERFLLKLEHILEAVNEKGYTCSTFFIMSGYRTPYYNQKIGNVKYSRHVWGGAADIFIDENPKDGMMDDLNKDGKQDYKDALIIYNIIDDMYGKSVYERFVGGLGLYKKTQHHGPFVHVDVRGFRARWGY